MQNIIFDFGNVLFDLDLGATDREIRRLLGDHYAAAREKLQADDVFRLYEVGGLSTEEFVDALCRASGQRLSAEQVVAAWNSIFIGMPRERFDMLLRLRGHYPVFLLSNINDLHANWIDDYMAREHGLSDFQSRYFDGVYYSHLIRLRKPDRDIYEYVLADAELLPGQTVFIDDLEPNIQAAQELGITGILKTPDEDILDLVERMFLQPLTGSPSRTVPG
ncbi:MAG: HAD family phosphatase [Saprospiraceae bacterium]|jgi:FMN phosphatase YigB (HAD superfamily)|nr:HAD family phosphatase [Saprospiraceae bacterium]